MHLWQMVWRNGFAPQLSTVALEALARGLADDDRGLVQGTATFPPPLEALRDSPVQGACAVCYALWRGEGLSTIGNLEEAFHALCRRADEALGEPSAVRYFLNWFDDAPRQQARLALLAEVRRSVAGRAPAADTPAA